MGCIILKNIRFTHFAYIVLVFIHFNRLSAALRSLFCQLANREWMESTPAAPTISQCDLHEINKIKTHSDSMYMHSKHILSWFTGFTIIDSVCIANLMCDYGDLLYWCRFVRRTCKYILMTWTWPLSML